MAMILVGDHERKPCAAAHPGRAWHLLNRGRAAVLRRYPFTLILKAGERAEAADPLRLKIDPGSKTTGLALVKDATGQVVWADWRCGPTGGAGRLAVRATGSCNIMTARETVQGIPWTYCQPLQRGDGYTYTKGAVLAPQA